MRTIFPRFASHADARCFNCDHHPLLDPRESHYPQGKWQADCPKCELTTFYDLLPKETP